MHPKKHAVFLGTAGYHPSETRHTSGVFVPDASPDDAFLLDAGTGTFRLIEREIPRRLHVFLTHAHLDHSMGLTFLFNVAWNRDLEITVYAEKSALEAVKTLFDSPLFPLPPNFHTRVLEAGAPLEIGGARVSICDLVHPGGSIALRFDWSETSLALVTDTIGNDDYFEFLGGVHTLIHECNFPNRFKKLADVSGHCTSAALIRAARSCGAKQVVATHFNPRTKFDPLLEDNVYREISGVVAAFDGLEVEF